MHIEEGSSQPQRSRMVGRKIQFQPLGTTTPAKPQRVGAHRHQDNSALTVWDENGNEIFGDADFMVDSGRERHAMNLLYNSDESCFIG